MRISQTQRSASQETPMIRGYASHPGVLQGEVLRLHIASETPVPFRIWFYRQGERLAFKARSRELFAEARSLGAPDLNWNWPVYEYPIPRDWESGAYLAYFVPIGDKDSSDPAVSPYSEAAALFVVKNRMPNGKILYKLPLFTYHAYNEIGDPCGSFYTGGCRKLTLRRPGGGVGGRPWDHYFPDYYDTSSPRQTFWHWDAPFIRWLERRDFAADYCTDLDIHKNFGNYLRSYRLLLSVGHDEYWSEAMRRNVEAFVQRGGNVAFFSGNTCWWRVHLEEGHSAFVCDKTENADDAAKRRDRWFDIDPENRLTGVSHRNGGGHWWGERPSVGYTVQHAEHWTFAGTGLRDGDTFGVAQALVGYECDGAAIAERPDEAGFAVPSHNDGTPEDFTILGIGRLGPEWAQEPDDFPGGRTATMGIHANKGVVFNAATTDWARVLGMGDPHVEKITQNVLHRLGSAAAEHPALQAWRKVCPKPGGPASVEVLREGTKSCIFRLVGAGPGGASIIAKRCRAAESDIEQTIYEQILPSLPISRLQYYGRFDERDTEYRWFFIEDGDGQEFAHSGGAHCRLAARWLGQMHASASHVPAVWSLPDHGPRHYIDNFREGLAIIQHNIRDPILTRQDRIVLEAIIALGAFLESRWTQIERLCRNFPQTLVHGDFAFQNLQVRPGSCGENLVVFDWEKAGYGIPAADIAELSGRGCPRRRVDSDRSDTALSVYCSVVRETWPELDLPAAKELAEVGGVFRSLIAISWECQEFGRGWWPIPELRGCHHDLAAALDHLDFPE